MTPAEISLRDQQLDEEGHDDNCPVFTDGECSGPPVCSANTERRAAPRRVRAKMPALASGTVHDLQASQTHEQLLRQRYIEAMRQLGVVKAQYAAAGTAAQAAHEEWLREVLGPVPG